LEEQLKAEVEDLLRKAEEAEKEDLPEGMNVPEELARRQTRIEAIAAAKEEIERRAAERFVKEQQSYQEKLEERNAKEKETGKKPRGPRPKPPTAGPKKEDQVNLTDNDSRIMPASGKSFEQAYNSQAAVDVDSMLIVENHITQHPNDKQEIGPTVDSLASLPENIGAVDALLADTGYFSHQNVETCIKENIIPYIATERQHHNITLGERFTEPPPTAAFTDPVDEMKHRLKTRNGKSIYAKRKSTVETVFGIIKSVMGFRQFLLRGLESVSGEWNLVCIAYNIKRLYTLRPQLS
jgi:hypothetical protein